MECQLITVTVEKSDWNGVPATAYRRKIWWTVQSDEAALRQFTIQATIFLSAFGFASSADATSAASQVGMDSEIQLDIVDSATMLGVNVGDLIEKAFSKLKVIMRQAAERTIDDLWDVIAQSLDNFDPTNTEILTPLQDTNQS